MKPLVIRQTRSIDFDRQTRSFGPKPLVAMALAIAVIFAAGAAQARSAPDGFADLAAELLPSVVNISTSQVVEGRSSPEMPQLPPGSPFEEFFKEFFDRNMPERRSRRSTSLGSGFIISNDGYIVTNNHVIQDADGAAGGRVDGRVDADHLAVEIEHGTAGISTVDRGVGLNEIIVGTGVDVAPAGRDDPGRHRSTQSKGVADGDDPVADPRGVRVAETDRRQVGIAFNLENSEVGLGVTADEVRLQAGVVVQDHVNLVGQVIGINTAIYSPSGGSVGIGFAIPTSTAEPVIRQLMKHGEVKRGWLGVHIQQVTEEIAESLGLDTAEGALVASVIKEGPAEKAEIKAGDIILEFDGKKVAEMRALPRIVADTEVGKPVDVVVWRDSKKKNLKVTVGELDDKAQVAARTEGPGGRREIDELGLTLSELTDSLRERYKIDDEAKGVVVTEVDDAGPASEKGIRAGDLIVEVAQEEVTTPTQVVQRVEEAKDAGRKSVLFLLEGQGGLRFVAIRLEKG